MLLPFSVYAILAFSSFTLYNVEASSRASGPIKRVARPINHAIDIFPRASPDSRTIKRDSSSNLRYDDSFRLTLSVFEQTYHLHLSPNDHLIHPAARITYHETDPLTGQKTSKTVPLLRKSVKAYHGHVVHPEHTNARKLEDITGVVTPSTPDLGWARIVMHDDGDLEAGRPPVFEGAFSVGRVVHHVVTKDNYLRAKQSLDPELVEEVEDLGVVIWRETDISTVSEQAFGGVNSTCGHDTLEWNTNPALRNPGHDDEPSLLPYPLSWWRRDVIGGDIQTNYVEFIGQTAGCPTSQKLVYMGVAADCVYVSKYGSSQNATQKILNDWNSASALYKSTFNISLGIVEMQVQSGSCPTQADPSTPWNIDCSGSGGDINHRLSLFSQWRGTKGDDGAGLWHLMSGCPTGQQVGIAWLSTVCQVAATTNPDGQIVSGTGVSTFGLTEWQVVAHEIGHNFGAIHDCNSDLCGSAPNTCCPLSSSTCNADQKYVMNPASQPGEHDFSPCTIGNICSLMRQNAQNPTNQTCLLDPSTAHRPLLSLKMCGNGIVEDGEDCDPGSGATSPCCDSSTCKFKSGAKCDPLSSLCCTDQCDFAPSGKVCRPSKDSACDVEEKCTGNSGVCPADVVKPNGESCGAGELKCASGFCTSVAKQCQSQGASMNLTDACRQPQTTCELVCQDPKSSNACVKLSTLMIDGSPCGYAGTCKSGKCEAGKWFDTFKAWYTRNLQIAIPVTIAAALVVLLILYCIYSCICGGRRKPKNYGNTMYMQVTPSAPPVAPSYNPNKNYQRLAD